MRLLGGEFYDVLDLLVLQLRKTLSVRVAAADVYREKPFAVADRATAGARYLQASGVVLLLGPVLRGKVLPDIKLPSVEERLRGPRDSEIIKDARDLDTLRDWGFPLNAGTASSVAESVLACRGWPAFHACNQKRRKSIARDAKALLVPSRSRMAALTWCVR